MLPKHDIASSNSWPAARPSFEPSSMNENSVQKSDSLLTKAIHDFIQNPTLYNSKISIKQLQSALYQYSQENPDSAKSLKNFVNCMLDCYEKYDEREQGFLCVYCSNDRDDERHGKQKKYIENVLETKDALLQVTPLALQHWILQAFKGMKDPFHQLVVDEIQMENPPDKQTFFRILADEILLAQKIHNLQWRLQEDERVRERPSLEGLMGIPHIQKLFLGIYNSPVHQEILRNDQDIQTLQGYIKFLLTKGDSYSQIPAIRLLQHLDVGQRERIEESIVSRTPTTGKHQKALRAWHKDMLKGRPPQILFEEREIGFSERSMGHSQEREKDHLPKPSLIERLALWLRGPHRPKQRLTHQPPQQSVALQAPNSPAQKYAQEALEQLKEVEKQLKADGKFTQAMPLTQQRFFIEHAFTAFSKNDGKDGGKPHFSWIPPATRGTPLTVTGPEFLQYIEKLIGKERAILPFHEALDNVRSIDDLTSAEGAGFLEVVRYQPDEQHSDSQAYRLTSEGQNLLKDFEQATQTPHYK